MKKRPTRASPEPSIGETTEEILQEIRRAFGTPRLTVELLPATTWGSNLRSSLRTSDWDKLRRAAYAAANHICQVCGGAGHQYRVACHERWEFDDVHSRQRLVGLIALCPGCHDVKHFGRANESGRGTDAMLHLCEVNDWSMAKAERYLNLVFALWKLRTRKPWHLDLTWLTQFGVAPTAPPLQGI